MSEKSWESLTTEEHRTLLGTLDDDTLSKRFQRSREFFVGVRAFFNSVPPDTSKPKRQPHSPPKDLIMSARRDLSFYEANYELIDNSIDEWRKRGATTDLHVEIEYNLEQLTGKYTDDAGGMDEKDVFRVFIPGETTNRNFGQTVIGSFGLGAKKGIFRLTDGAKVVSSPNGESSFTSEVPERWESDPEWTTQDGRAEAITKGTTQIYFFKLFKAPTLAELDDLRKRLSKIYGPLLRGRLGQLGEQPTTRLHVKVNGVEAPSPAEINWSSPDGAEPRIYKFSHVFKDFLSTGQDIELRFLFACGLTRQVPGAGDGRERDFGIDVYGNGRLIQQFLKDPFGWGTSGLSKSDSASKFVRGELFINGHSFAIPWDTHKREYLSDHVVAQWLREQLRNIIKGYKNIAGRFTSDTELRKTVLETTKPQEGSNPQIVQMPVGGLISESLLPAWKYKPSDHSKTHGSKASDTTEAQEGGESAGDSAGTNGADLADTVNGDKTLSIILEPSEYDELLERFAADATEELETAIRDCLVGGVAFNLTAEQLTAALKIFNCDGDVGQLSTIVKSQLLKKIIQ